MLWLCKGSWWILATGRCRMAWYPNVFFLKLLGNEWTYIAILNVRPQSIKIYTMHLLFCPICCDGSSEEFSDASSGWALVVYRASPKIFSHGWLRIHTKPHSYNTNLTLHLTRRTSSYGRWRLPLSWISKWAHILNFLNFYFLLSIMADVSYDHKCPSPAIMSSHMSVKPHSGILSGSYHFTRLLPWCGISSCWRGYSLDSLRSSNRPCIARRQRSCLLCSAYSWNTPIE